MKKYASYKLFENKEDFTINDKGEISFRHGFWLQTEKGMDSAIKLINYLASELADAQVDLWLRNHSFEGKE